MGKGSAVLGVLVLILGAGGLGLGGFAWFSVSNIDTQVNSWTKFVDPAFICNPSSSYLTLTGLTIDFVLEPGDSVYFSFTSTAHVVSIGSGWFTITVFFSVDGISQTEPIAQVGMYAGDFLILFTLHLETVRTDLSPGMHNVTVVINGESTGNYIFDSVLFVQKVII